MKIKDILVEQSKTLSIDTDQNLSEFNQLFESVDGISDESKTKLSTLYEAAVKKAAVQLAESHINKIGDIADSKVDEEKQHLAEAYEEYQKFYEKDLSQKLDLYLERAVNNYMTENEVAIELGIKSSLFENLMTGLKTVFTQNYVDLPEDKVDVVKELTENVAELNQKYDEVSVKYRDQLNENMELKRDKTIKSIYESYTDLTDTQKEKINSLSESLEMNDKFEDKFKSLVEAVSNKQAPGANKADLLKENDPEFKPEPKQHADPAKPAQPVIVENIDDVNNFFA